MSQSEARLYFILKETLSMGLEGRNTIGKETAHSNANIKVSLKCLSRNHVFKFDGSRVTSQKAAKKLFFFLLFK